MKQVVCDEQRDDDRHQQLQDKNGVQNCSLTSKTAP
jgi:hypothetical protein